MLSTADIKITREKKFAISFFLIRVFCAPSLSPSFFSVCTHSPVSFKAVTLLVCTVSVGVCVYSNVCVSKPSDKRLVGRSDAVRFISFGFLDFKFNKISIACNILAAIILRTVSSYSCFSSLSFVFRRYLLLLHLVNVVVKVLGRQ